VALASGASRIAEKSRPTKRVQKAHGVARVRFAVKLEKKDVQNTKKGGGRRADAGLLPSLVSLDAGVDMDVAMDVDTDAGTGTCKEASPRAASQQLLTSGVDVNTQNNEGDTPLHDACHDGTTFSAEVLLKAGAAVDKTNRHGETPLHYACYRGCPRLTTLLLRWGANVHARDENGHAPLHLACWHERAACAELLLWHGAGVDAASDEERTPLHDACSYGHVGCTRLLLWWGTNVHARDEEGETPLHTACLHAHTGCVELLLAAGADANAVATYGRTPLHCACERPPLQQDHNKICVASLLKAGASVKARDEWERTPLHYVCRSGEVECARLLLEAGSHVAMETKNRFGHTPLRLACTLTSRSGVRLVRLLLEWGASVSVDWMIDGWQAVPRFQSRPGLRLMQRAARLRKEGMEAVDGRFPLDWSEGTHELLADEDRTLLNRALGALLLVDARREGGASLGREGALAFVAGLARLMAV
jgi:ankyrin repeat protein